MSDLPDLHWKKLLRGTIAVSAQAAPEVLDALWSKLAPSNTTYYDLTTWTPGTTGPTVSRYQDTTGPTYTEALHWTHPVGNHKSIIAGQTSSPPPGLKSPSMASTPPDTYAANVLLANIVRNAGAFSSWDSGTPFTSGTPFGNWRWSSVSVTTYDYDIYECEEAVAMALWASGGAGSPTVLMVGAWLDPHSQAEADAEATTECSA